DAGAAARSHDKAGTLARQRQGPFGEHAGDLPGVFVIASHLHAGAGALERGLQFAGGLGASLACRRNGSRTSRRLQCAQLLLSVLHTAKTRRAEEHDRVLNLFMAEPGERLGVLGEYAQDAAIWAVEEVGGEGSERGGA